MTAAEPGELRDLAARLARAAGTLALDGRRTLGTGTRVAHDTKSTATDPVTEFDRAAEEILDQDDTYIEAWNKLATCHFMSERHDEALETTRKALDLDPYHFQAMNGLGLIHFERKEYKEAVDCFRKSIAVDPWSPVASKLSLTLDILDRLVSRDEPSH